MCIFMYIYIYIYIPHLGLITPSIYKVPGPPKINKRKNKYQERSINTKTSIQLGVILGVILGVPKSVSGSPGLKKCYV